MANPESRRWVFTLNNYTPEDESRITGIQCRYLVYGRERGESGTPHLQGYLVFASNKRFNAVKALVGDRSHIERARGSSTQASDYCKKDGDYVELGELPDQQGRRTDLEKFVEWCGDQPHPPTQRELIKEWPCLYAKYKKALVEIASVHCPRIQFDTGSVRDGWQSDLETHLEDDAPNDRVVEFYVDTEGNSGKSWMVRYLLQKYEGAQQIRPGKELDMAYEIDESKWIFLFDVPRSKMEHFQYSILECLKDRMIFSGKYDSRMKTLRRTPHVLVFCNEEPDMEKLSMDRYLINRI